MQKSDIESLRQTANRRRIIATERADGTWTMTSSDEPLLVVEDASFEDCFITLEESRELMRALSYSIEVTR